MTRLGDHRRANLLVACIRNFLVKKLVITPLLPFCSFEPSSQDCHNPMWTLSYRLRITWTLSRFCLDSIRVERMCRQALYRVYLHFLVSALAECMATKPPGITHLHGGQGINSWLTWKGLVRPECGRSDSPSDERQEMKERCEDGLRLLVLSPCENLLTSNKQVSLRICR